jgi:hypothetical protein
MMGVFDRATGVAMAMGVAIDAELLAIGTGTT